ncbi:uncharacterized protein LOC129716637 [Wyeomyia smithii]|uniref:uncharacterized protein LOC129716637 n=1 Tax=Wyeomyia smithii TaxID=174621 RepID=UPI002467CE1F|nr:uncharacterized protein LOC129716637 [Wyeomyia smithii]
MSEVWNYFIKTNITFAECKICHTNVPRRGNTTNLKVHLQKHPNKEKALECTVKKSDSLHLPSSSNTKTLDDIFRESELWTDQGSKTKAIDNAIAFMVVKDYQPVSVLETSNVTLTADIWTDSHTTRSDLGMTCHFFNSSIIANLQTIDLGVYPLYEWHQSFYISSCFEEIIKQWSISKDQVSFVVTDHAANMVKAVVALLPQISKLDVLHTLLILLQRRLLITQRTLLIC